MGCEMKKKWSAGKVTGLVLGIIAAVIVLGASFVVSVIQLAEFLDKINIENHIPDSGTDPEEEIFSYEDKEGRENKDNRESKEDFDTEDFDAEYFDTEYYDFENAIREDLDYQADIEIYQRDDFIPEGGTGSISVYFEYPVISGDIPNIDGINQSVYKEITEIEEYMDSVALHLSEEDVYDYVGTGYVTCMTDEFFSIAYVEYGYLNK